MRTYQWFLLSMMILFLLTLPFLFVSQDPAISELDKIALQYTEKKQVEKKDLAFVKKYYALDQEQFDDYRVYASISAMGVDEIAIFRVKDHATGKEIKKKVEARLSNQKSHSKDTPQNNSLF